MKTASATLFAALILGLTWAVRGHFGHEWGAAWAGATGALAVMVSAGRIDWIRRLPTLTALGALGWGVGGMMSYGIVISYCRADSFLNSLYGYCMLAIIGGLYGFLGGGLLGLGLETSKEKKPNWFILISGMVSGGCLFWGLFIVQLEWFMTPPRSEAWGLCAGAAIAMAWYFTQEGFPRSLRVATYSGLGSGFGFAVGNFIQTLGSLSGISYNWWNVMEFTLGFFGGLGMAYAISTTLWPKAAPPQRTANWLALLFITILIPWTNYIEAFESEKLIKLAHSIGIKDLSEFAPNMQLLGFAIFVLVALAAIFAWKKHEHRADSSLLKIGSLALFAYTFYYVTFAYLLKGFFHRPLSFGSSDTLYLPIMLLAAGIWLLSGRGQIESKIKKEHPNSNIHLATLGVTACITILTISAATVYFHDHKIRFHERFPTHQVVSE